MPAAALILNSRVELGGGKRADHARPAILHLFPRHGSIEDANVNVDWQSMLSWYE
jgi:hypothetical protein